MSNCNTIWTPQYEAALEMLSRLPLMNIKPEKILLLGSETEIAKKLQALYPAASIIHQAVPDQPVDMIFANFVLPWLSSIEAIRALLKDYQAELKPNGLLMLSALGLDTLKPLQAQQLLRSSLIDLHDLGDLLLQTGWADPVLDIMHYTLQYNDQDKLVSELVAAGMVTNQDKIILDELAVHYEIVYAHAFLSDKTEGIINEDGVVRIPLAKVKQSLINK